MPTSTLSKFQGFARQKPLQRGMEVPDKHPGYPGRRLSRASFVTYMGWLSRSRLSEQRSQGQLEDGWFMECNKERGCCVCMRECASSTVLGRACSHVHALLMHWCVRLWQIPLARCLEHHFPLLLQAQMFHLCMPNDTHIMDTVLHASQLQLFQKLVWHGACLC